LRGIRHGIFIKVWKYNEDEIKKWVDFVIEFREKNE